MPSLLGLVVMAATGAQGSFITFLPIPLVFALWRYAMEREGPVPVRFSLYTFAFCILAFGLAWLKPGQAGWLILAGACIGLFVWTPSRAVLALAVTYRRRAVIALYGGFSIYLYTLFNPTLWMLCFREVGALIFALLTLYGVDPYITYRIYSGGVFIRTSQFHILIFNGCSGFEGVTLFLLMLSAMLLADWNLFKRYRLWILYLSGALYVMAMNILRITAVFLVGHHTFTPDASETTVAIRNQFVYQFHNFAGWAFYMAVFFVFALCLYRHARRRQSA